MDHSSLLSSARMRPWVGYVAAVALPFLSSGFRTAFQDIFVGHPYVTFFLVVLGVSLIGSRGAAVLATILSAMLATRFAVDSKGSLIPQSLSDSIGFALFLLGSGIVIVLVNRLSTALVRLTETQAELAAANAQLEQRVAERTAALDNAHDLLVKESEAKSHAEEQARHSQKMETIGLLTGGIAHDFNNMLSVIVGSLELIRRRLADGSTDVTKHLDNAMDGAQRSAALTHRLLAFARKQPLAPSLIDPNERIGAMEELLDRTLGSTIAVRIIKEPNVWTIKADPSQLENAILNLAVNARDAMPSGGDLVIETKNVIVDQVDANYNQDSKGQYVEIAVTDTGVGMSKDLMSHVFEPFFTTKPSGKGTGLGLSQLYGFIKQSGGFVRIDSALNFGTTIKLYLPKHVSSSTNQNTDYNDNSAADTTTALPTQQTDKS